ncbi:lysine--tRNA ligase [Spirochaeta cellobiosiphila]|uniref:lysine--tRNA ligase n=1 Tax=Spirochaeta cellobiosiphila TaxID=504483 RepID=UPI00041D298B|nr:lysine--tRNA ligase [Spirochaeta cellobiosiphila]
MKPKSSHWADINAAKIVREKGEKDIYVCASGITPSGTIHIGNFREIMSVDLVVRALQSLGKQVKFVYSWDDYDVFRKVPKNMPAELEQYLRQPITLVPDTTGVADSYARANEIELETQLHKVGIDPHYIYQANEYRASKYAEGIKIALQKKEEIRAALDEHRTTPLPSDWMPVSVFCNSCNRDTTRVTAYDGDYGVSYECECGHKETVDLRNTKAVKLPWRIDWPMRWKHENVDFEPAGKDHHSEGGSFDTSRNVVKVFDGEAPVTFQYDFISIKGRGGKISSSSGEVISLRDVLEVYTPEVCRFLFAGTRPNTEFSISFDLDVLKIYEDYDKCERIYFGVDVANAKKKEKNDRIYELSQTHDVPKEMPFQVQIRHLTNQLQTFDGDIERTIASFGDLTEAQKESLRGRAVCAWNWVKNFAPEDFRFSIRKPTDPAPSISEDHTAAVKSVYDLIDKEMDTLDEKALNNRIYDIAHENNIEPVELFKTLYLLIVGKEKGPRLASFLKIIGKERLLPLLG